MLYNLLPVERPGTVALAYTAVDGAIAWLLWQIAAARQARIVSLRPQDAVRIRPWAVAAVSVPHARSGLSSLMATQLPLASLYHRKLSCKVDTRLYDAHDALSRPLCDAGCVTPSRRLGGTEFP
jgi:hypothetical protein